MRWFLRFALAVLALVLIVVFGFRAAAMWRESEALADIRPATGAAIATSGGEIFVTTTGGRGPDLLLLHGTGAWGGLWQETASALAAAGFKAHAMDLPPFGFSERQAGWDYSRDAQADRILALIEAMEIRPIMVAHSFGASAGVEAVMKKPDAFAGLVIVAGAVGLGSHQEAARPPLPLRIDTVRRVAVSLTATNPMATRLLLSQMLHKKSRATRGYADILRLPLRGEHMTEAVADWSLTLITPPQDARSTRAANYEKLRLPTRLIWGDRDTITPLQQGQKLTELISGAELIVLPELGHVPQVEDPPALQTALIEAVTAISSGVPDGS